MSRLIANPCSEIAIIGDVPGRPLLVGSCRRGRSTSYTLVDQREHGALFAALFPLATATRRGYAVCSPIFGPNRALRSRRLPRKLRGALRDMGLLIDAREAPRRVRYDCRLSTRPLDLLPRRRADVVSTPGAWIVHPGLVVVGKGPTPAKCVRSAVDLPEGYSAPTAWLKDPATLAMTPLWPTPGMHLVLTRMQPGSEPAGLPARVATVLKRMGVLISKEELKQRRRIWKHSIDQGAEHVRERGYWVIERLFCDAELAALRRYYRELIEQGFLPYMDTDGNKRCFVTQNEPIALFFQKQLTALMQRVTRTRLRPSFMSLAAYQGGAALEKHVDGPTSDWNISLQLDFSPEPTGVTPWELCLQTTSDPDACERVYLGLGDAVIYRGNATPHFRPRLPRHMKSTAMIYHWQERR